MYSCLFLTGTVSDLVRHGATRELHQRNRHRETQSGAVSVRAQSSHGRAALLVHDPPMDWSTQWSSTWSGTWSGPTCDMVLGGSG